jgi:glycosyltransferase involved in cell wall biosynthesis
MPKIKIIQLIPSLSIGGAERMVIALAAGLDRDIFEVSVVCLRPAGEWKKQLEEKNIPVKIIGNARRPIIFDFFNLVSFFKQEKPDIVHTHLFGADVYGRLAARLAGVPVIVSTEHNLNFNENFPRKFAKFLTAKLSDRVIAVSRAVKEYLINKEGVASAKIDVVYNGIDVNAFSFPERNYENNGKLIIGALGRLAKQKGFDKLIGALSGVDGNWQCLIAGEGMEGEKLQNLINVLGMAGKIKLVGVEDNAPEFLRQLDIFVMPSRWEGLGLALLEAGASGLPVIASRVDGLKELIDDGVDGFLFSDEAEFKEKIALLLADADLRKKFGLAWKEKVETNFSLEKMIAAYEKIYQDLSLK